MEIQNIPAVTAQGRIQEEAAVKVQAMAMQNMKDTGAELARLMDSAKVLTDPAKGNYLNMLM